MNDFFDAAEVRERQRAALDSIDGKGDDLESKILNDVTQGINEMVALRDQLSRLRAKHNSSKHTATQTQAALFELLESAQSLLTWLDDMYRRAPAKGQAEQAVQGLGRRVAQLTRDARVLRRQVFAEKNEDLARRHIAVGGDAADLVADDDSDSAMRPALLSAAAPEEQEEAAKVERGLLDLQQEFMDMAALVDAQGAPPDVAVAAEAELREAAERGAA